MGFTSTIAVSVPAEHLEEDLHLAHGLDLSSLPPPSASCLSPTFSPQSQATLPAFPKHALTLTCHLCMWLSSENKSNLRTGNKMVELGWVYTTLDNARSSHGVS